MTDRSINWWRVTVPVSLAVIALSEIGTAREIALQLQSVRRGAFTTPRHWVFGWPD